jgi:hypothetical protein
MASSKDYLEFSVGMTYEKVKSMFLEKDILSERDMNTGYYWMTCWVNLFSEAILTNFCFKDGVLCTIEFAPHITPMTYHKGTWDDLTKEKLDSDYKKCGVWFDAHKNQLPKDAKLYYDNRSLSMGILIAEG